MRGLLAGTFALSLGFVFAQARGDEGWAPLRARPAPDARSAPDARPAASLGRPIAVAEPMQSTARYRAASPDPVQKSSYNDDPLKGPIVLARSQAPEAASPSLTPAYTTANQGFPTTPEEQYNQGVVTDPAAAGAAGGGNGWLGGFPWFKDINWTGGGRKLFESDHCFDNFVSPISSPFFAEDPRSLTELRPIFLWQQAPSDNPIYRGGNITLLGTQARVALTDRLSFVMNKLGWIWNEPNNPTGEFAAHSGLSEIWLGPKYTFWRDDRTGTLMAAGLTFQIASGARKVFQDTGTCSLVPYVSFAQNLNFLPTGWGSFNFMSTAGYAFGTDDQRSDYFFSMYHLDYDLGGLRKFYPMIELTWVNYTSSGKARDLTFEGRDLFNFGSTLVSGHNDVTLAVGARYKFTEAMQLGVAAQFPVTGRRDLADFRLTVDMIFRY